MVTFPGSNRVPQHLFAMSLHRSAGSAATFFTLSDGSPRAIMGIRRKNDGTVQTLNESVADGDTVGAQLDGTGSIRFLPQTAENSAGGAAPLVFVRL